MKKICTFNENADNILAFLQLMALVIILGPSPKEVSVRFSEGLSLS